jgi:hypothetical protein
MKYLVYLFLLSFSSLSLADTSLSDQLNALDNAQSQSIANQKAREQAAYEARVAEQQRLEQIANQQREADRKLQEKALHERAEQNRVATINAKIAADKAEAQAKAINDERLQDKYRQQAQEDEEREFMKRQSSLEIQQAELETQRLKAKADLEAAIANDRIKSVEQETALARKKESAEIDVTQSGADANRTLANGISDGLSGAGNSDFYKFLVVLSLIILVLLGGAIFWRFSQQQKANKNQLSDTVDKNTVNPATEEQKDDASITEASEKEA